MNYNKSLIDYLLKTAKVKDPALRGSVRLFWNSLQEMVGQQIKAPSILALDDTVVLTWAAPDIKIEAWIDPDSTFVWSSCGTFSATTCCYVDIPPRALARLITSRFLNQASAYEERQLQLGMLCESNVTYKEVMLATGLKRTTIARGFHRWSAIKSMAIDREDSLSAMLEVEGTNPDRIALYLEELQECGAIPIGE